MPDREAELLKQETVEPVETAAPDDFEAEVHRRLMILEYLTTLKSLPVFVAPAMTIATVYGVIVMGWETFSYPLVYVPLVFVTLAILATIAEFFTFRRVEEDHPHIPGLTKRIIGLALWRGISLGLYYSAILTIADEAGRTAILMATIMAGTLALATQLRAIATGFGLPVLLLVWASVAVFDVMNLLLASIIFSICSLLLLISSTRARNARLDLMRATLSGEQAVKDQLAAEEALRASQVEAADRAREMQDALINAIAFSVVVSHGDDILVMTPETRRQFKAEVDENPTLSSYFVDPEDQMRLIEKLQQQGRLDDEEVVMKDSENNPMWVAVSMRPLQYDGKDCWLNSIYNIDARKKMETEIAKAKEDAEAALEKLETTQESLIHAEKMASLGQLTAGIAHEIKNPLNFVNNFSKLSAEMLDELAEELEAPIAALDGETKEDVDDLFETIKGNLLKIDEHGKRADSIVKNMLAHSRDDGAAEQQQVKLNELAIEAMNLAYHGARAADKSFNVELETALGDDVGEVLCTAQELQRVILNLCSNGMYEAAKRFAADGGEGAKLTLSSAVDGDHFVVDVTDNGGGVPDDIRDKIFQPFFTTKPTGEGTGLGLSMSYDIIKQHGGELSLADASGAGSTFRVRLPISKT